MERRARRSDAFLRPSGKLPPFVRHGLECRRSGRYGHGHVISKMTALPEGLLYPKLRLSAQPDGGAFNSCSLTAQTHQWLSWRLKDSEDVLARRAVNRCILTHVRELRPVPGAHIWPATSRVARKQHQEQELTTIPMPKPGTPFDVVYMPVSCVTP